MNKLLRRLAIAISALLVTAPVLTAGEAGAVLAPGISVTSVTSACGTPRHIRFTLELSSSSALDPAKISLLGVLSSSGGKRAFTLSPLIGLMFIGTLRAPARAYAVQWLIVDTERGREVLASGRTEFPAPGCPDVIAINAEPNGVYMITDGFGTTERFGPNGSTSNPGDPTFATGAPAVAATGPGWPFVTNARGYVSSISSLKFAAVVPPRRPIVAIASTSTGRGFWLVTSTGGVVRRGDARRHDGVGTRPLHAPIVAIAPTPTDRGYWLVAADGAVYGVGNARGHGSLAHVHLNAPIVAAAATPSGRGYWLAASDGGVFTFGDARFFGSTGGVRMTQRVVGFSPTPSGHGYYMITSTGRLFHFGDAVSHGSVG